MDRLVEKVSSNPSVHDIVFQPGNGTRYEILIVELPNGEASEFLFCWTNRHGGGQCHRFAADGLLVYSYFQDKMRTSYPDTAALLTLIHEITGRTVVLPPGYDTIGEYTGKGEGITLGKLAEEPS